MIVKLNGVEMKNFLSIEEIEEAHGERWAAVGEKVEEMKRWRWNDIIVPGLATIALATKAMAVLAHQTQAVAVFAQVATNTGSFFKLLDAFIAIMDPVSTCVVVFAGVAWMFGQRTKAIELLIGTAAGTLIIMHAHDMVHWLRGM